MTCSPRVQCNLWSILEASIARVPGWGEGMGNSAHGGEGGGCWVFLVPAALGWAPIL